MNQQDLVTPETETEFSLSSLDERSIAAMEDTAAHALDWYDEQWRSRLLVRPGQASNAVRIASPDDLMLLKNLWTRSKLGTEDGGPIVFDVFPDRAMAEIQESFRKALGGKPVLGRRVLVVYHSPEAMAGRDWTQGQPADESAYWVDLEVYRRMVSEYGTQEESVLQALREVFRLFAMVISVEHARYEVEEHETSLIREPMLIRALRDAWCSLDAAALTNGPEPGKDITEHSRHVLKTVAGLIERYGDLSSLRNILSRILRRTRDLICGRTTSTQTSLPRKRKRDLEQEGDSQQSNPKRPRRDATPPPSNNTQSDGTQENQAPGQGSLPGSGAQGSRESGQGSPPQNSRLGSSTQGSGESGQGSPPKGSSPALERQNGGENGGYTPLQSTEPPPTSTQGGGESGQGSPPQNSSPRLDPQSGGATPVQPPGPQPNNALQRLMHRVHDGEAI